MDKKIKARWVKALRSGRYKQVRGYLEADGRYCCSGVLCKVVRASIKRQNQLTGGGQLISEALARQIGLALQQVTALSTLNDTSVPFPQIANWIEENL